MTTTPNANDVLAQILQSRLGELEFALAKATAGNAVRDMEIASLRAQLTAKQPEDPPDAT